MADLSHVLMAVQSSSGAPIVTQKWMETSTGIHARMNAAALVGQTTGGSEVLIAASTAGSLHINVASSSGVLQGIDNANAMKVSLYGKAVAAGDTAVSLDSGGVLLKTDAAGNARAAGEFVNGTDGQTASATRIGSIGLMALNGATWDRWRNNHAVTLLASAARSTDALSSDQTNYNARVHLVQIVYATSTGAAITPSLQVKDSVSSSYGTVWTAAAAISSTGHYTYLFDSSASTASTGPTEVSNVRPSRTWRLSLAHSSSGATTYSASVDNLV